MTISATSTYIQKIQSLITILAHLMGGQTNHDQDKDREMDSDTAASVSVCFHRKPSPDGLHGAWSSSCVCLRLIFIAPHPTQPGASCSRCSSVVCAMPGRQGSASDRRLQHPSAAGLIAASRQSESPSRACLGHLCHSTASKPLPTTWPRLATASRLSCDEPPQFQAARLAICC